MRIGARTAGLPLKLIHRLIVTFIVAKVEKDDAFSRFFNPRKVSG
jgi:hypothetical protein